MAIFDDAIKQQLSELLKSLENDVTIHFFSQEMECGTCKDAREFLNEFMELSDKLHLKNYEFVKDKEKSEAFGIDKIPAIVVTDKDDKNRGVKFYGIPAGYEINSFIASLMEASGKSEALPEDIKKRIEAINKKIHIQVFVTLSCPYCPQAVATAHRLAYENDNISADMVDSSTFFYLANKYNIQGVPKVIINETHTMEGAQPITEFLNVLEKI